MRQFAVILGDKSPEDADEYDIFDHDSPLDVLYADFVGSYPECLQFIQSLRGFYVIPADKAGWRDECGSEPSIDA